jgi:hypothetical protein
VPQARYGVDVSVRCVVLPATPLLVPGAAGRALVLREVRAAVLAALRELGDPGTGVTVVAGSAAATARAADALAVAGPALASLAAAGIADERVAPPWRGTPAASSTSARAVGTAGTGASVALLALGAAGCAGPVDVVELGPGATVGTGRELGRGLRTRGGTLVVAGDPRYPALAAVPETFVDAGVHWDRAVLPGADDTSTVEVRWCSQTAGQAVGARYASRPR